MITIRVDTETYSSVAEQLKQLSSELDSDIARIGACKDDMLSAVPNLRGANQRIEGAIGLARKASQNAARLVSGANRAGAIFEECDNKVRSIIDAESFDTSQSEGLFSNCPFIGFIGGILEWLGIIDPPNDTAPSEEDARDLALQDSLRELLREDSFDAEAWRGATDEQRRQMLEDALERMNEIYGTDVKTDIEFFTEPAEDGMITLGWYNDSKRRIAVNTEAMTGDNYQGVMETLMHEMRHAYQHEAVRHPENFVVSADTISAWETNFQPGNYKTSERDGYDTYRNQPIESDAFGFSEGVF